jgi:hypothetical protein
VLAEHPAGRAFLADAYRSQTGLVDTRVPE